MGEINGAWQHGAWTNDVVALRKSASKLLKRLKANR